MKEGLQGKRVVLAASRKTDEMSMLIEKQKGIPLVRSLQGTVFLDDDAVKSDIRKMIDEPFDCFIFTTGIGTEALIKVADEMGLKDMFIKKIQETDVAARGYKTYAVLKKLGVKPIAKDEDGTTKGLVEALGNYDFEGKNVMVQLHGENAPSLITFLEERGAYVLPTLPYRHTPAKEESVSLLVSEMMNGSVDAVCFTTAIQVRELFTYARKKGMEKDIRHCFHHQVLAVAVGKVTAEALTEEGVERMVYPELERMGAMIIELSRYYSK